MTDADGLANLDVTIAQFIAPRLKAFRETEKGHPSDLTQEEWDEQLADMQFAFDLVSSDDYFRSVGWDDTKRARYQRGMDLFRERFEQLWT